MYGLIQAAEAVELEAEQFYRGLQALFRRQILNHQEQVISELPAMYERRASWQKGLPRLGRELS